MKVLRGRSKVMKLFENAREGTEKLEPEVKAGYPYLSKEANGGN